MHIISPPSFCLSGLLNKPRLRSKKKFFDLGEALAYLTGHSGRRGGGLYYMHFRPEKVLDNYYLGQLQNSCFAAVIHTRDLVSCEQTAVERLMSSG